MKIALIFHRITNEPKSWTDVSTDNFIKFIDVIAKNNHSKNKKNEIILTFDDGHDSDYYKVFPYLKKNNLIGYFFIITSRIDTEGYLTWNQIKEMNKGGMIFGSHSHLHSNLKKLAYNDIIRELRLSKKMIEKKLGVQVEDIAYPFGQRNVITDKAIINAGYKNIYCSAPGMISNSSFLKPRFSLHSKHELHFIHNIININHKSILAKKILYSFRALLKFLLPGSLYHYLKTSLYK